MNIQDDKKDKEKEAADKPDSELQSTDTRDKNPLDNPDSKLRSIHTEAADNKDKE